MVGRVAWVVRVATAVRAEMAVAERAYAVVGQRVPRVRLEILATWGRRGKMERMAL